MAGVRQPKRHVPVAVVLLAGALVWTLTSASPEAQADINIQYDKTFSFAGLNTWAWHPDGAGDVRLAVSADDDPKRVAARVDPVIIPAVEKELATRKLTQAGAADAALYVHYYVLVTVGQSAQVMGQFVAPVPDWGLPPFSPSTTALTVYPVGTLLVDITARGREGIVWRGAAQRRVELEKTDAERRPVLERAIRDLFRNFPPRK